MQARRLCDKMLPLHRAMTCQLTLCLVQELAAAEAWALQSVLARLAAEAGSLDTALRAVCGEEEQANLHGGPLAL